MSSSEKHSGVFSFIMQIISIESILQDELINFQNIITDKVNITIINN